MKNFFQSEPEPEPEPPGAALFSLEPEPEPPKKVAAPQHWKQASPLHNNSIPYSHRNRLHLYITTCFKCRFFHFCVLEISST